MTVTVDKLLKRIDELNAIKDDNDTPVDNIPKNLKNLLEYADSDNCDILLKADITEALIICLDKDYQSLSDKEKKNYIMNIKQREEEVYEKIYKDKNYKKLGLTKKVVLEKIRKDENSDIHILYLSDFFGINIAVLNSETLNIFYSEERFNRYKPCVLLYKDDRFCPVVFKNEKVFTYNSIIVRSIIDHDNISIYSGKKIKVFETGLEPLDDYLVRYCSIKINNKADDNCFEENIDELESDNDKGSIDDNIDNDNIDNNNIDNDNINIDNKFEQSSSIFVKNTKTVANSSTDGEKPQIKVSIKMAKKDLVRLAEELNIDVSKENKKLKTKQELCDEINKRI